MQNLPLDAQDGGKNSAFQRFRRARSAERARYWNILFHDGKIGGNPWEIANKNCSLGPLKMGFHTPKVLGSQFLWLGGSQYLRNESFKHGFVWNCPIFTGHNWAVYSNFKISFNKPISHRIHGAAIYGNIYHQYTPVMLAYIPAPWFLWVWIAWKSSLSNSGMGRTWCSAWGWTLRCAAVESHSSILSWIHRSS